MTNYQYFSVVALLSKFPKMAKNKQLSTEDNLNQNAKPNLDLLMPSDDTNYLHVIKSTPRRLSYVKNDDFAFPAHRESKLQFGYPINIESGESNTDEYSGHTSKVSNDVQSFGIANEQIHQEDSKSDYYGQIWKYSTNNSIMRYTFMRKLRKKILLDLERHFGRKVLHDRLFSCLGKLTLCKTHYNFKFTYICKMIKPFYLN